MGQDSRLTAIDLFSGAGGLTCGLKQAGFKVLSAVEIAVAPATTYKVNHKDSLLIQSDICQLSPTQIMRDLKLQKGQLTLLAGCPPCQGFSSLRTRNKALSLDDPRNDLIFEFLKWIEVFYPQVVMLENVPALAKDNRMLAFCQKLELLGYILTPSSLRIEDISHYGVPQRRRRMILIMSRKGAIEVTKSNFKSKTVREVFKRLKPAGQSGDPLHDYETNRSEKIKQLIRLVPKNGGSRDDLPQEYWLDCHKRYPKGFKDVYGRMAWDDVAPTITGGCINPSKGRFLHPEENRAITLREASLLQTFPIDYKFPIGLSRDTIALMIGNALPPEFIKQQALLIKKHVLES
ncbi:MAG: hypothetical protein RLZZ422_1316 [Pseudomonadota bacterium]|jgi:DNA (cytosine-5)-methyltransferase 1